MNRQITITIDDRREPESNIVPLIERRGGESQAEPFVAPWRRRQIAQAHGNRFAAVADLTERSA